MYNLKTIYLRGSPSLKLLIFLVMLLELVKCLIPCQRENQNILIFDIVDKILCVFAPNGPIVYLISNIQQHQDIHLI